MQDQEQVLSLVGLLYDATLDKNKWEPFLEKCCEVFNASSAQWGHVVEQSTKISFTALYGSDAGVNSWYKSDSAEMIFATYALVYLTSYSETLPFSVIVFTFDIRFRL